MVVSLSNTNVRRFILQATAVGLFLALVIGTAVQVADSLQKQGMVYGWAFLGQPTGWDISAAPLAHAASDPYWWTILLGLLNTLVLALVCIVVTTILGFLVGLGRLSRNFVISFGCRLYTDIFRNVPSILQIVFWYQIILHLPQERRAVPLPGGAFISNRGIYLPGLEATNGNLCLAVGLILMAMLIAASPLGRRLGRGRGTVLAAAAGAIVALTLWFGAPVTIQLPHLHGFSFENGLRVPAEFAAVLIGLSVLGTAYVAEIVRGGIQSIGRGPVEAGRALGLHEWMIDWKIRIPLGLRAIVLPLGNQYLITVKNTSLGAAIGYSDLFAITSNSINMNGHTFEMLGVMVGLYLVVNYCLSLMINWFNARVALKGARSIGRQPAGGRA
ncbi:ABC transporter permease [Aliidongia dinghuensis]|uniref:ABC transporter permease n=1 Tax=Aliidongia dinghuensis TaxID=1867774 RepID=A0A8J3E6Y8_9PROT|nr:ABC transporter permease subunit [Aliidongia dinghuensis]GGF49110.1 ABC transporter permease [Aliidongia dinghuensis]